MHIYDYLFAGVIIIALLLGSTVMVTTFSSPASNAADKDILKIDVEKIMTQIMLDSGYPYNWGSDNTNPQNLKGFGLAKYGATSRQAYELDPDKVQRINIALDGSLANFVSAESAANLLSLNNTHGSLDYGFTLEFNETLKVNVSPLGNDLFSVSVSSDYALPIIGATVSATLYYMTGTWQISFLTVYSQTSYDGSCLLNFDSQEVHNSPSKVLAVAIDYYGAQTAKFFNAGSSVRAALFGNYVLPYPGSSLNVTDGYDCHEILLIQNSSGIETRDFRIGYSANSQYLTLDATTEPNAIGVIAVSRDQQLVYAQRDFSEISYRTIPTIQSTATAYSLERTVLIGGVTYAATLYLWRMSS